LVGLLSCWLCFPSSCLDEKPEVRTSFLLSASCRSTLPLTRVISVSVTTYSVPLIPIVPMGVSMR
jgi:hypothetical protein